MNHVESGHERHKDHEGHEFFVKLRDRRGKILLNENQSEARE
jgi:hypothetical protein